VNSKFRKVFVVQDFGKYDLILLEKQWGEIIIIGKRDFPTHSDGIEWIDRSASVLEEYTKKDGILLVGDPVLVGLAFHMAMSKVGMVNCIKWSHSAKDYYSVTVNLKQEKI